MFYNTITMDCDVIVIGGGPAGLMAGIAAAELGAKTVILEKEKNPGRKLLASGNGRCNLTNKNLELGEYLPDAAFAAQALSGFGPDEVCSFFEGLGVPVKTEDDGRIFTRCGRSLAVLTALQAAASAAGAKIIAGTQANKICASNAGFEVASSTSVFRAGRLALACGSPAYPQLGGSMLGLRLAESLGHTVNLPRPALVPLCVKEKGLKRLSGIRAEAQASVFCGGAELYKTSGEALFTDYGISGPVALNASRYAVPALKKGRVVLKLNFFPDFGPGRLAEFLEARKNAMPARTVKAYMNGLAHEALCNLLADCLGLDPEAPLSKLRAGAIKEMACMLCAWPLEITGPRPLTEAMVCSGGVPSSEINPGTMESLKRAGLYLAGEMIDMDGPTGGYNLHFAWATGLKAGRAAAGKDA